MFALSFSLSFSLSPPPPSPFLSITLKYSQYLFTHCSISLLNLFFSQTHTHTHTPLSSPNTPNLMFFFVYFPFVDFFYIFILSLISSHASYFPSQLSPPPSLILHLSRSLSSFLYTLSVRYDLKQPCVPLGRGRCQGPPSLVALTPDTHTVAVACGSDIEIFACVTGEVVATIASAHQRMCVGS